MKALYIDHLTKYGLVDRPMPTIKRGEVLIKVKYAAICHTDIIIRGGFAPHGIESFIPGHEFVGEVVQRADDVENIPIGSRGVVRQIVVCNRCEPCLLGHANACENFFELGVGGDGGFAEYCAVPASNFHVLPDHVAFEDAVLTEPLANAVSTMRRANVGSADRVVVIGPGAIGLLCLQIAALSSPRELILVGTRDERLAVAKQVCPRASTVNIREPGAEHVLKDELLSGKGANAIIECSGTKSGLSLAIDLMADYGRICFEGTVDWPNAVPFTPYALKSNGTFYGIIGWEPRDFQTAFSMIAQGRIATRPLITQKFPLSEWREAFEMATTRKSESIRVLLEP